VAFAKSCAHDGCVGIACPVFSALPSETCIIKERFAHACRHHHNTIHHYARTPFSHGIPARKILSSLSHVPTKNRTLTDASALLLYIREIHAQIKTSIAIQTVWDIASTCFYARTNVPRIRRSYPKHRLAMSRSSRGTYAIPQRCAKHLTRYPKPG
jgi:hypothetical protein